jgi:hypothetical protein
MASARIQMEEHRAEHAALQVRPETNKEPLNAENDDDAR